MTTVIKGQPPSSKVRSELAALGRPVLLAFSRGKDSIAAWLALRDAGIEVVPYHMWQVPDLPFISESLAYYEDWFGVEIADLPHPTFYRWLGNTVFQPPERLSTIDAAQLPKVDYSDVLEAFCEDRGISLSETWICDGVRAADSIVRRASFSTHGVWKSKSRKVSPVWDWTMAELRERISESGIELPIDYEWFGRSFDGLDYRFSGPLRDNSPEDFEVLREWFPLIDLEIMRHEQMGFAR